VQWVGIVVHAILKDDTSGLDVLEAVRAAGLDTPALAVASHGDSRFISRARRLRAEVVSESSGSGAFAGFARRAVALHWTGTERLALVVDALAAEHELAPRESELVAAAVTGMPRRIMAGQLHVSENTIKVQVRRVLAKIRAASLDDVADEILWRAMAGASFSRKSRKRTRAFAVSEEQPSYLPGPQGLRVRGAASTSRMSARSSACKE
jgi:DNA-binding NarL/FixJ family response regulator